MKNFINKYKDCYTTAEYECKKCGKIYNRFKDPLWTILDKNTNICDCPICTNCYWKHQSSKYNSEYYQKNKERIKEIRKKYREDNKKKIREVQNQYRKNNKEKIKKYNSKYYEKNKEKAKLYHKQYYYIKTKEKQKKERCTTK